MNMQYKIAKIVTRNTKHQMVPSKINAHDFVVVENIKVKIRISETVSLGRFVILIAITGQSK